MIAIDMEMPTSCRQCEFEKGGECFILTTWMRRQELAATDGMRDDCPLLDVPEEELRQSARDGKRGKKDEQIHLWHEAPGGIPWSAA